MDDDVFDTDPNLSGQDSVISTEPIVVTTYSSHARHVLQHAESAAAVAPGGAMTSEHLLLCLVSDPDCAAAQTLASCGLDRQRIEQTITFVLGSQAPSETSMSVVLSPRVERVLTTAGHEAANQKAGQVDTLHLLIALLREKQGIAALALESPGVGFELVGAAISQAMRDGVKDPS